MTKTLQFTAHQSPSLGPKAGIVGWYLLCLGAAVWLTVLAPVDADGPGNPGRRLALLACGSIYVVRAAYTLYVFVKRTIPWWEATWGGSLLGLVLFVFLWSGLRTPEPLGLLDGAGLILYAVGSYLGTASEHARHVWKARPENRGHLYEGGLFRYSRHINYFGDLLLFAGLAVLTRQPWAGIVPLAMGLNFALMIIPAHDAYLASRYNGEFDQYARRTRKLIPFLY